MIKAKVKYFNSSAYQEERRHQLDGLKYAVDLQNGLDAFECKTIDEVETQLTEKTGFVNHKISASAMGLEDEYLDVLTYYGKIELDNYNKELTDITEKFDSELKEKYTTYWSKNDASLIDKINKLISNINEYNIGRAVSINHNGTISFNEKAWDLQRQFNRIS